ncbi:type II secretory pathway component GspD/PulD (secretin) [Haloferula luteola]|uniref:Type II secretory pathway component GspD/PulD (Secretin) n=1 Tax=Haloferula luteola TaxID=595692 RepID=A0A840V204_9BACT|nr:secretin N-terminal domain-containing protein [Haloferula luteola]MBB5352357.1 type II secretory pathway component GspD/PulD (secretin) [Haloferula luteola]
MKHLLTLTLVSALSLQAQTPPLPGGPPITGPSGPPTGDLVVEPGTPIAPPTESVTPVDPAQDSPPAVEPVAPLDEVPLAEPGTAENAIQESEGGFVIQDAPLNEIFQFLAKEAGRQYFHNIKISTPEYRVTGHLNDGDPLQQMEELAFMYGLMLYTKGNTVYALTQTQLSQLPSTEATYKLNYLRPSDAEAITGLVRDVLSPGTGIVKYEPKTNTLVLIDSAHRIEKAKELLRKIDQPKGQIIVETKILRVNSSAAERVGVNWSGSLGETGTTLEVARSLNSIFGIQSVWDDDSISSSTGVSELYGTSENLVLSPIQLRGVMRALNEGNLATQISNPTLITEDNEQGTISIIDRVPIITTTTNQGTGDVSSVSEEVRYKIDESDPDISNAPEKHREIGISMVATPTLLPDGTIRMNLRPRSAQITEQIRSAQTSNVYPRVTESMIDSTARIPDGFSLVVGGFYGESESKDRTKVPLLGDVPVLNFFFKSKETVKEQTSLVFIVTPTSYDPASRSATGNLSNRIHRTLNVTRDIDWVDPANPGPAHEPNLRRALRGLQPQEAPYYPTPEEVQAEQQRQSDPDHKPRFSRVRR